MLVYHTPADYPRIVQLENVEKNAVDIKSFAFQDPRSADAKPGQFLMVWVPGVDEIPLGLSSIGPEDNAGFTVLKLGKATSALNEKKRGDIIGVRGPYGTSFTAVSGKILVVAGGIGVAPLMPLTEALVKRKTEITLVFGVKTSEKLLFMDRIKEILSKVKSRLIITTDDGSFGVKGLASDPVKGLLEENKFSMIYTCGKEPMMYEVFKQADRKGIPVQASLERFMKCGIGICGQCVLDPLGLMVCKDGPIFQSETLRKITDFGVYSRTASGKRIHL
ncbi:MAG TPA: dihydroorotate dehydrogenase electron transfer subunit [archaeon]|nr:dihydroorotate dehydrogenase electron transfer subunit [archaeon]